MMLTMAIMIKLTRAVTRRSPGLGSVLVVPFRRIVDMILGMPLVATLGHQKSRAPNQVLFMTVPCQTFPNEKNIAKHSLWPQPFRRFLRSVGSTSVSANVHWLLVVFMLSRSALSSG